MEQFKNVWASLVRPHEAIQMLGLNFQRDKDISTYNFNGIDYALVRNEVVSR
jgi:hypothetical protein